MTGIYIRNKWLGLLGSTHPCDLQDLRSARSGLINICVVVDFYVFWKMMLAFAHVNILYAYVKKVGFNQLILGKKNTYANFFESP